MVDDQRVDVKKYWRLLTDIILRNTEGEGVFRTNLAGLAFHRRTSNGTPNPHFLQPVVIVMVQGRKLVRMGTEEYHYGEHSCFVAAVDMPVASCVMEASATKPYLSMSLDLNMGLTASIASRIPFSPRYTSNPPRGAIVHEVGPDLLDAFLRLAQLTEKKEQIPIMEELLQKEIHYRLLQSPSGNLLQKLSVIGSQSGQIVNVIEWLKENYKESLRIEEIAERSGMAPSTFHKYFKKVTTLSPLQYQKRLRLAEAQRLLLTNHCGVAQAASLVGYESVSQFSREYKRLYGYAPSKNGDKKCGWLGHN